MTNGRQWNLTKSCNLITCYLFGLISDFLSFFSCSTAIHLYLIHFTCNSVGGTIMESKTEWIAQWGARHRLSQCGTQTTCSVNFFFFILAPPYNSNIEEKEKKKNAWKEIEEEGQRGRIGKGERERNIFILKSNFCLFNCLREI